MGFIRMVFPGMGIPIIKIRWWWNCFTFIMGIPILVRRYLYINSLWPRDAIWRHRSVLTLAQVWLVAWRHQAITWTNVDLSSIRSSDIHLRAISQEIPQPSVTIICSKTTYCPACRTTLVATRFRVAVICPIIQEPHCIRVFFYFVWFVFINHIFQFYYELCTYCNILDIYLS